MLNKIILPAVAVALSALLTPSEVGAYGAAHVGYTHVGPNGVQHYGATAVATPHGDYSTQHASAYGASGGAYHAASGTAATTAGGYHYDTRYYGGATTGSVDSYHYGYVR